MQARLGAYEPRMLAALETEATRRTATTILKLGLTQLRPSRLLVEGVRSRSGCCWWPACTPSSRAC